MTAYKAYLREVLACVGSVQDQIREGSMCALPDQRAKHKLTRGDLIRCLHTHGTP